jgi:hypothetical protein
METLEITSSHSLTTSIPDRRPVGAHSYQVNCRQFISTYKSWQKHSGARGQAFGVMTLGFDRIWITEAESAQVAAAIQATRSPVALD